MKKFYESPIVEITIFDVEDVVATDSNVNTLGMNETEITAIVEEWLAGDVTSGTTKSARRASRYNNYNW